MYPHDDSLVFVISSSEGMVILGLIVIVIYQVDLTVTPNLRMHVWHFAELQPDDASQPQASTSKLVVFGLDRMGWNMLTSKKSPLLGL